MFTRNSWFMISCSLALALTMVVSAPTRACASESVSYTHHAPPPYVIVSWDTVTYAMNWDGVPYCAGFQVYLKAFGVDQPNASSDPVPSINLTPLGGGTGGASDGSTKDVRPGSYVNDGIWICYDVAGTPSDGSGLHHVYTGAYCYYRGG